MKSNDNENDNDDKVMIIPWLIIYESEVQKAGGINS